MVKEASERLKGWAAIAEFLGQTAAVAQTLAQRGNASNEGGAASSMPIPEETHTLGSGQNQESKKPVHIASDEENLTA